MLVAKQAYQYIAETFAAAIFLHSNQLWKDLRKFYQLTATLEKFLKIKKSGF
jgi:hypothetical protein